MTRLEEGCLPITNVGELTAMVCNARSGGRQPMSCHPSTVTPGMSREFGRIAVVLIGNLFAGDVGPRSRKAISDNSLGSEQTGAMARFPLQTGAAKSNNSRDSGTSGCDENDKHAERFGFRGINGEIPNMLPRIPPALIRCCAEIAADKRIASKSYWAVVRYKGKYR